MDPKEYIKKKQPTQRKAAKVRGMRCPKCTGVANPQPSGKLLCNVCGATFTVGGMLGK